MCDSIHGLNNFFISSHGATKKIDFQTRRLNLRRVKEEDLPALVKLTEDYRIADMMNGSIPYPYTKAHAETWLAKHVNDSTLSQAISWAIADKEKDLLIGSIQLRLDDARKTARLSYWLGSEYWNKGFATEAGEKIIEFGFTQLGLTQIEAEHFRRNPSSGRVLNKLGFQFIESYSKAEGLEKREEQFLKYIINKIDN